MFVCVCVLCGICYMVNDCVCVLWYVLHACVCCEVCVTLLCVLCGICYMLNVCVFCVVSDIC